MLCICSRAARLKLPTSDAPGGLQIVAHLHAESKILLHVTEGVFRSCFQCFVRARIMQLHVATTGTLFLRSWTQAACLAACAQALLLMPDASSHARTGWNPRDQCGCLAFSGGGFGLQCPSQVVHECSHGRPAPAVAGCRLQRSPRRHSRLRLQHSLWAMGRR